VTHHRQQATGLCVAFHQYPDTVHPATLMEGADAALRPRAGWGPDRSGGPGYRVWVHTIGVRMGLVTLGFRPLITVTGPCGPETPAAASARETHTHALAPSDPRLEVLSAVDDLAARHGGHRVADEQVRGRVEQAQVMFENWVKGEHRRAQVEEELSTRPCVACGQLVAVDSIRCLRCGYQFSPADDLARDQRARALMEEQKRLASGTQQSRPPVFRPVTRR
jgi:hypothetical protein